MILVCVSYPMHAHSVNGSTFVMVLVVSYLTY